MSDVGTQLPLPTQANIAVIREALQALRGWLPEPHNEPGSASRDESIVTARRKHNEALAALADLEANLLRALVGAE